MHFFLFFIIVIVGVCHQCSFLLLVTFDEANSQLLHHVLGTCRMPNIIKELSDVLANVLSDEFLRPRVLESGNVKDSISIDHVLLSIFNRLFHVDKWLVLVVR